MTTHELRCPGCGQGLVIALPPFFETDAPVEAPVGPGVVRRVRASDGWAEVRVARTGYVTAFAVGEITHAGAEGAESGAQ
jgi:hypothetical protein